MLRRIVRAVRGALRTQEDLLRVAQGNQEQHQHLVIEAVDRFYAHLGLPGDKIPHCRFETKKRLMDLYAANIVFSGTTTDGCFFRHLEHDVQLFMPFAGFDEYVGLCWDVYVAGYPLTINAPFVVVDIGSNLFNSALSFAQNPLCRKVFCYELVPEIYQIGQRNLALNPRLREKIADFNFGLYNKSGELDVTYYPLRAGASGITERLQDEEWLATTTDSDFLVADNRKSYAAPVREAFPVIKDIADACPEDEIVVKVDAENSEVEILENLTPLFDRIYCFFVETHTKRASEVSTSLLTSRNFTASGGLVKTFYNNSRRHKRLR